jgi:poly-gamma-glutamate synthesis protein (capsule biosynthesis protein)
MHVAVKRSAEAHGRGAPDAGYGWLYAPVADLLSSPDVTFANLETPIATAAGAGTRDYVFNAPPDAVAALRDAGVDVVSVANNHVFDQGRAGFEETLRRVEAGGLLAVGAGPADRPEGPVVASAGGLSIAFLGWARFFNQDGNACPPARPGAAPCVQAAQLDPARAVEAVRAAAAQADAVVVSLHWGAEYEAQPRAEDVELAHALADAGALVVLGHHPHVLQPVELYRRAAAMRLRAPFHGHVHEDVADRAHRPTREDAHRRLGRPGGRERAAPRGHPRHPRRPRRLGGLLRGRWVPRRRARGGEREGERGEAAEDVHGGSAV